MYSVGNELKGRIEKKKNSIHILTSSKAIWFDCRTWDWEVVPCRVIVFYSHLPLHSSVQVNPNLKHLHLPRHSDLQPHLASCSQLCATGAFAVQNNPHYSPIFFQPQSAGLSASGWHWVAWPHMQAAWYAARLVCWSRAALVGGMASYGLCFRANMSSLASTLTAVIDRSYSRTTRRYILVYF